MWNVSSGSHTSSSAPRCSHDVAMNTDKSDLHVTPTQCIDNPFYYIFARKRNRFIVYQKVGIKHMKTGHICAITDSSSFTWTQS